MRRPLFGPGEIGVRGPMPGIPRGYDPQLEDDRAWVAWAEEHGCEPHVCVLCGALVEQTNERGHCEICAEDLARRRRADVPVSAEDFGPPRPSVHVEELPF